MLINSQTKIAALLKHHPDALEAIVTLSADFKKLRNPILRRLMAGRTSIAMAAKIGGCKPEDFYNVLKPFGFEADVSQHAESNDEEIRSVPQFIKNLDEKHVITLDVRSMLSGGTDPLKLIQQTIKPMQAGEVLKIVNTFEPTPLIKLLEKQGFGTYTDFVEDNLIETYFCKTAENVDVGEEVAAVENDWDEKLKLHEHNTQHIDVRHLEMPQPMMTILEGLENLPENYALFVQHKRIPVYLLSELKDRNFDYRIKTISDSEVHLLIFRN